MKKILISLVSVDREGIQIPWLLKFKKLEELGYRLDIFGAVFLKELNLSDADVYKFNDSFLELGLFSKKKWTKPVFIFHSLKKNVFAIFNHQKFIKKNYDVIYSPASVLDLVIFPYFYKSFRKNIKWVTVFDNIVPFTDPGNKIARFLAWFFFRVSLFLLKKADRIFVVSDDLRNFLLERGFGRKKIVLSENGIENDLIQNAKVDEKCNIDAIFVGRINETKGIYDMLKVLDIVRKRYPRFQLAIMGKGDETTKRQFKKKINEMGLEDNVQFLGYKTGLEKFNIMKAAKCFWFLSVSRSESFGVALLEAVACGLPAFAYDLPQFSRLYPNGEVDISPMGNYKLVAEKVIGLFENGNFTNEKGKKLLEKYSWDKIAEIEYNAIKNL